ncbi:MAG: glucosamine-6-phosphate deaminase [Sumerlaeia bacterium]
MKNTATAPAAKANDGAATGNGATQTKSSTSTPSRRRTAPSMKTSSKVEQAFLDQRGRPLRFAPNEKASIVEVSDFPTLGRLTALRFLEWVLENPEGVVSLPTGKTPEYFIRWTKHYLENWTKKATQEQLASYGIPTAKRPELHGLRFVQIDEFYPIEPTQRNSFYYYVMKHYIRGFGLDPERALLIDPSTIGIPEGMTVQEVYPDGHVDLSLRSRQPKNDLETLQQQVIQEVDQFCSEFEQKIRDWGGIGFFLGGIGPDGHIGFNARGSHLHSPTRLTLTNYETEAAAAGDLGGIEVSRNKPVITIGLGTITFNPEATVIIFAAGEAKAPQVAAAVEKDKNVLYPASVLQDMKNARFYLTTGACLYLNERNLDDVLKTEKISDEKLEKHVFDRAVAVDKRLEDLTPADLGDDRILKAILEKTGKELPEAAKWTQERLMQKIARGLETPENETILHTGPHHDDIMLGYMPYIMHLVRRPTNKNFFTVLTSGFTAVTNNFLASVMQDCLSFIEEGEYEKDQREGAFFNDNQAARAEEVYRFLDGIAARDDRASRRAQARRMLYNLMNVYEEDDLERISERINENLHYLSTLYPGKKDVPIIQKLKGMQREYEEELIWGYVGTAPQHVHHLRLGFYTGDIFTEQPTMDRDVLPFVNLLKEVEPTTVTVTIDPEGAGPDTHYKVLQVINEGLVRYKKETGNSPKVWGYRNVWYRFHPSQANVFIPATLNTMAIMDNSFMNCFGSQKAASFPSFEYDGPFSEHAQNIWVAQFRKLRTCLGERFFIENDSPRLRAARGMLYLKTMTLDEFSGISRTLAKATEGFGG